MDSAEDDEDRGPGATWARRVGWHQASDVVHVDKAEDCPIPRCPCGRLRTPAGPFGPKAGDPPTTPGGGSFPRPLRWIITGTVKGEGGGTISVSAKSLEEAYHLVTAAAGESGWDLPQGEADAGTRLRSNRVRHPHAE